MTDSTPRYAPRTRWETLGVVEYTFAQDERTAPTTLCAEFDDKEQVYSYFVQDAFDRRAIDGSAFAELRNKARANGELVSVETRYTYCINGAKTNVYCYRDYVNESNDTTIVNRG